MSPSGRDDDDELPPSEEELAASKRLRDALEDPSIEDPAADLARSLRAAFTPEPIDAVEHARIVDDAPTKDELVLAEATRDNVDDDPLVRALRAAWNPTPIADRDHKQLVARVLVPAQHDARRRVVRVTFAVVTGAVAIAASVFVWVNAPGGRQEVDSSATLARARSTQPLFPDYEGFKAGSGDASARIDKIALARAGDFRDNRFAKWGVR